MSADKIMASASMDVFVRLFICRAYVTWKEMNKLFRKGEDEITCKAESVACYKYYPYIRLHTLKKTTKNFC